MPSHHSVQLVWEFFDGSKWVALRPDTGEVADDTRSLTLDGVIRLTMPSADTVAATTIGEIDRAYYYLRCRFSKGQYDTPPQIAAISVNAVTARQIDPAWQRLTIAAGATVIGTPSEPGTRTRFDVDLDHTGTVAALSFTPDDPDRPEVRIFDYKAPTTNEPGWLAMEMVCLGVADGKPHQQVQLEPSLVVADSVRLYSLEDTLAGRIWRLWECRPDLDASRRADAHYTLVPSTGEVAFGDGERGRVSVRGAALMAAYDATQADEGNLPAATPLRLANTPGNEGDAGRFGRCPSGERSGATGTYCDQSSGSHRREGSRIVDVRHWPGRGDPCGLINDCRCCVNDTPVKPWIKSPILTYRPSVHRRGR